MRIPLQAHCLALANYASPLIGKFVVAGKTWQWTQWTALFFIVAAGTMALFVQESYKSAILRARARKYKVAGPPGSHRSKTELAKAFLTSTVTRPISMLFKEPIVGLTCVYSAFDFGVLYCLVIATPYIFDIQYGFSLREQGLAFIGLIVGALVGTFILVTIDYTVYQPLAARRTKIPPESRLYAAMIGSVLLPLGMFWFAFTARPSIHWVCPIFAQLLVMTGAITIYVSSNLYVMDTYGPLYGASANAANSLARYTTSAVFPLFTLQMLRGLGIQWAVFLLAMISVCLLPVPWSFYYWGPQIRAKSRFPYGD